MPQRDKKTEQMRRFKALALEYWTGILTVSGGPNNGERLRLLDEFNFKKEWLDREYGREFNQLLNNYKKTQAYLKRRHKDRLRNKVEVEKDDEYE